jgi:hypothetical protein
MNEAVRRSELAFELAVTTHLEDQYGLQAHVEGDVLNRRRSGYAVLRFRYHYDRGGEGRARVQVSLIDSPHSRTLALDLRDPEVLAQVAPLCEDLAPYIRARLEKVADPPDGLGRREDD